MSNNTTESQMNKNSVHGLPGYLFALLDICAAGTGSNNVPRRPAYRRAQHAVLTLLCYQIHCTQCFDYNTPRVRKYPSKKHTLTRDLAPRSRCRWVRSGSIPSIQRRKRNPYHRSRSPSDARISFDTRWILIRAPHEWGFNDVTPDF